MAVCSHMLFFLNYFFYIFSLCNFCLRHCVITIKRWVDDDLMIWRFFLKILNSFFLFLEELKKCRVIPSSLRNDFVKFEIFFFLSIFGSCWKFNKFFLAIFYKSVVNYWKLCWWCLSIILCQELLGTSCCMKFMRFFLWM